MADRPITPEEFHAALEEILDDTSGEALLTIPGLYEVVSEHYNNEAIKVAHERRERTVAMDADPQPYRSRYNSDSTQADATARLMYDSTQADATARLMYDVTGNNVGRAFGQMQIAEDAIKHASRGQPFVTATRLDRAFIALRSPLLDTAPDKVFRAHCDELLERVINNADLCPGTNAEAVMTFSRASLTRPPGSDEAKAYAIVFDACFPGSGLVRELLAREDSVPGEPLRMVEAIRAKCGKLANRSAVVWP